MGVDLWTFATADGRNLRAALRYVAPFADPAKTWPKEDIKATDRARLLPLLDEAQRHEDDADFRALLAKFGGTPAPGQYWRLAARAPRR